MPRKKNSPHLLQETLALLSNARERGTTLLDIYEATRLHPNWISRLSLGKIPDPGVNRVQKLHDYLRIGVTQ